MTKYWENFKGWKMDVNCPVCKDQTQYDTQQHSFSCEIIRKTVKIEGAFTEIYCNSISENLAKTVERIEKLRENYISV